MSNLTTSMDSDLVYMIADLPSTLRLSGTSYTCTKTPARNNAFASMAGIEVTFDCRVFVRSALFTDAPKVNQFCTVDGTNYKIGGVTKSQDGYCYILELQRAA